MIYISTGGLKDKSAFEACELFSAVGLNSFELSGGIRDPNLLKKLKSRKFNYQVHNYFPPPKDPFVLNLASLDSIVSSSSIDHVVEAMRWAVELDNPRYSFHAGFLLDPKINELGNKIINRVLFNREHALERFIDNVNLLAEKARCLGVELLIENNVLSKSNKMEFRGDPFLMTSSDECIHVMKNTSSNVNLLVDVAHLKVSSNSLNFDAVNFLTDCDEWINAYHLSDNDCTRDSNEEVTTKSWFWPYLKTNLDYYTLEIYNISALKMLQQNNLTINKLCEK